MARLKSLAALLALWPVGTHAQSTVSLFEQHTVPVRIELPNRPIRFDKDSFAYRTRLRQAYAARPNFAGHYVVAAWGCGSSCLTGGIVDKVTGHAHLLPWSVITCCFSEEGVALPDGFEAMQVRADSDLIILNGLLNEEGAAGRHLFRFDGTSFQPIRRIPDDGSFKEAIGYGPLFGH